MESLTKTFTLISLTAIFTLGCASRPTDDKKSREQAGYHHSLAYGHFFENKDGDAALQEILASLKLYDKDPEVHLLAGLIFTGRSDWLSSMKHYKRALDLKPDFHEAKNNLGTVYLALGQWKKATQIFKDLVQEIEYRTPAMGHNNLGWAQYKLGRHKAAQRAFVSATQLNPRLCPPYNNAGLIYLERGDLERAERSLQRGIKQCPLYAEPHFHLGRVYTKRGQNKRAQTYFKKCTELSPDTTLGVRCERILSEWR